MTDWNTINASLIADLKAEVARLRTELREAIEFAGEGWSYASPYFQEKWAYDERLAEFASAIETPRPTSAPIPNKSTKTP